MFRDLKTGKLIRDNEEMVAIDIWRGILLIKGLLLDTPFVNDPDNFVRNQPHYESILDFLWRNILVKKGFITPTSPAKRISIDTVIETRSFQPERHIRFDKKKTRRRRRQK